MERDFTEAVDGLAIASPNLDYVKTLIDRSTAAETDLVFTGGTPQPQTTQVV